MKLKIGGQAIIEGIMLKSNNYYVMSVLKDNKIIQKTFKINKLKCKLFNVPIFRGFVNLIDMLALGTKSLVWSTNVQAKDDKHKISKSEFLYMIGVSLIFGIGLFVLLPLLLTKLIVGSSRGVTFSLVDGILRISAFFVYIMIISKFQDVRKVFKYHGAEHKVVNCFEDKKEININNVKKYSTFHPRCGTSFIVIVLIISIIIFSFIRGESLLMQFEYRLIIIPIIAGISYELLLFMDIIKNKFKIVSMLLFPGKIIQQITAIEPDEEQIRVAIATMNQILRKEKYDLRLNETY